MDTKINVIEEGVKKNKEQEEELTQGFFDAVKQSYSEYYEKNGPTERFISRVAIIKRMHKKLKELSDGNNEKISILDIGSGPQPLEQYFTTMYKDEMYFKKLKMFSMDIAKINLNNLLSPENTQHIQADAKALPFVDKSMDIIVSNMAIDFLPEEALIEVNRVLKKDGSVFFNFHSFSPNELWDHQFAIAEYERRYSMVTWGKEMVKVKFNQYGFEIVEIVNKIDIKWREKWLEIEAVKK